MPAKPRVALVSPLFESVPPRLYGGTERVVFNLCRGLRKANIDVTLYASGDSTVGDSMMGLVSSNLGSNLGSTLGSNFTLIPVIDEAIRLSRKPVFDPISYNFRMLSMIRQRAHEFDLIHSHHDYWMLPLSDMTQTPIVSTLHGRTDQAELASTFCGYPRALFVAVSECQRNLIPQLPWVKTIYHGIDVESFNFYEKPGSYLAFLGRISNEKKPEWAIEIALRSGVPLKIAAKIEGRLGQDYYDHWVKPQVDGKFIEYLGEISESEKSEFLGNALALVFPIDWPEPFGLVVIESLACGTPVLARRCGSMPELLCDGVTGFLNQDLQGLADRVKDVAALDRRNCRNWVKSRFSLQRMTEDYISVYRQIIADNSRSYCDRRNFLHSFQLTADGNSED